VKVDLTGGEWAELEVPKHLRQADVVDIVEYAEEHGIDLEGKYGIRAQLGLTNVLLTRYVTQWSLVDDDDGQPLPITMAAFENMPIQQFRALAVAVSPLLSVLGGALTEPDPLSVAASSSTEPTA
jgi:hypothetical protein